MKKFRKKPVEIEAMQLIDDLGNHVAIADWIRSHGGNVVMPAVDPFLYIDTLEGRMRADIGDYVIRGVKGEFYPCKPDIFEATYEPA
ncbi:hypothetical protein ACFFMR_18960 [Micromonospora andamanensis]|uniref:Phage protein n=1 Tax=Micromonospora andamanensis TaxID=1287068 RepID=A0ABQ4HYL0_9ACTN|nr:hypothetical protein [Micromonospora andamanensis]GIJ10748.1 hypothetical protein Van01_39620 [Micromonospora andamanensis]